MGITYCQQCGWDIPLPPHNSATEIRCYHCGHDSPVPDEPVIVADEVPTLPRPTTDESALLAALKELIATTDYQSKWLERIESRAAMIMWMMALGWLVLICGGLINIMESSH